jgi:hypothetical protein
MPADNLSKAAVCSLLLVILVIGSWEIYLRRKGIPLSYDNGKELWADKRAMVYEPSDKTTVFIGSSRIKYDLDISTWQKLTGKHAVQLAIEGSSPLPVLKDLGDDTLFHGRLVVDVTEVLFFTTAPYNLEKPRTDVAWYKSQTPAQWASFQLNHALESTFLFLDKDFFSLNAQLDKFKFSNRPGVFVFPDFPIDFNRTDFDRRSSMTDRFLSDTALQHQVQNVWLFIMEMGKNAPQPKENPMPPILMAAKTAVDKIRARGGDVVFTRTPSSGTMFMVEQHIFPREKGWNSILASTQCKGIYFADYPATAHLICPEWSHLSPSDATTYTKTLVEQLPKPFVQ